MVEGDSPGGSGIPAGGAVGTPGGGAGGPVAGGGIATAAAAMLGDEEAGAERGGLGGSRRQGSK